MSNLFNQQVQLLHGTKTFSSDDFTIDFDVPFNDDEDANIVEVTIYNLTDKTINTIKKGSQVILNAGYLGDVGSIGIGDVKSVITSWSGVDKLTKINILDGGEKWYEQQIKKTYKAGITAKQVLTDLLSKTGLKVGSLTLPVNKIYKSGKSVNKKLARAIMDIAIDCKAKVHVTRGKIYIRPKNTGDKTGVIIDKTNGLIGSPTPIEKEETHKESKNITKTVKQKKKTVKKVVTQQVDVKTIKRGFKVVSLLNHKITTDSIVTIKSKTAKGVFRVESGKHTRSDGKFYTELEVYPL